MIVRILLLLLIAVTSEDVYGQSGPINIYAPDTVSAEVGDSIEFAISITAFDTLRVEVRIDSITGDRSEFKLLDSLAVTSGKSWQPTTFRVRFIPSSLNLQNDSKASVHFYTGSWSLGSVTVIGTKLRGFVGAALLVQSSDTTSPGASLSEATAPLFLTSTRKEQQRVTFSFTGEDPSLYSVWGAGVTRLPDTVMLNAHEKWQGVLEFIANHKPITHDTLIVDLHSPMDGSDSIIRQPLTLFSRYDHCSLIDVDYYNPTDLPIAHDTVLVIPIDNFADTAVRIRSLSLDATPFQFGKIILKDSIVPSFQSGIRDTCYVAFHPNLQFLLSHTSGTAYFTVKDEPLNQLTCPGQTFKTDLRCRLYDPTNSTSWRGSGSVFPNIGFTCNSDSITVHCFLPVVTTGFTRLSLEDSTHFSVLSYDTASTRVNNSVSVNLDIKFQAHTAGLFSTYLLCEYPDVTYRSELAALRLESSSVNNPATHSVIHCTSLYNSVAHFNIVAERDLYVKVFDNIGRLVDTKVLRSGESELPFNIPQSAIMFLCIEGQSTAITQKLLSQ